MLLSVIIVSYNTQELTLATLKSVLQDIERSGTLVRLQDQTEIIVVDNNSKDESVRLIKKLAKDTKVPIKIIANDKNTGFSVANNQGIDQSKGQFILLLNSDTVVQPYALERLVKSMVDHPINDETSALATTQKKIDRLGIVSAQLYNPDGTFQPQGGNLPTFFSLACHMLMLDDIPIIGKWLPSTQHTGKNTHQLTSEMLIKVGWVGGTAMLLRRDMIAEIGNLEEQIFMYGEDVEYCLRAAHHHWDIAISPSAKIIHYGSASSSSVRALKGEFTSYFLIWSKHFPLWQINIVWVLLKIGALLRIFLFGTMLQNKAKANVYREIWREI
jgi:GT2 family glycosyltransferase